MSDLSKGNNSEANSSGTAAETNCGDLFLNIKYGKTTEAAFAAPGYLPEDITQ